MRAGWLGARKLSVLTHRCLLSDLCLSFQEFMRNQALPLGWDSSSLFPMDYLIVSVNDPRVRRKGSRGPGQLRDEGGGGNHRRLTVPSSG